MCSTLSSVLGGMLVGLSLLFPGLVWAQANLENPAPNSFQSGISVVSGWKCTGGILTFTIDNGPPAQLAYGTSRLDTQGVCGGTNNGFGYLMNWNLVGNGQHTIRVYDNGQQFAQATFLVATLGMEFVQGATGEALTLFPNSNTTTFLEWQESLQNFMIGAAVPNSIFPNVSGFYQITGSETHAGCTNPNNNGTFAYQASLPLGIQVGPAFWGTAVVSRTGGFSTSAVIGFTSVSGQLQAKIVSDSYSNGFYIGSGMSSFAGSLSGNLLQGSYAGGFVVGETCSVSGSISGVR